MIKYGFLATLALIFVGESVQAGPLIEAFRARREARKGASCSASSSCSSCQSAPTQTVQSPVQYASAPVQQASYVQTAPIPVTGFSFLPVAGCVNGVCPTPRSR